MKLKIVCPLCDEELETEVIEHHTMDGAKIRSRSDELNGYAIFSIFINNVSNHTCYHKLRSKNEENSISTT